MTLLFRLYNTDKGFSMKPVRYEFFQEVLAAIIQIGIPAFV